MRVISGEARGRKLKTPDSFDVRPTTDNVKESVFNILMNDVEGRKVLDLFAGTGQLGIEALSRGADSVVFVDKDPKSVSLVKENLQLCRFSAEVFRSDAVSFLKSGRQYDLIFVDPPYDSELYDEVLPVINSFDLLTPGGIIIVESKKERILPELSGNYRRNRDYFYGKVKITKYVKEI